MKSAPCKYCRDDRHIGCHSTCKKYTDWRAELDHFNDIKYKYQKENELYEATINPCSRYTSRAKSLRDRNKKH